MIHATIDRSDGKLLRVFTHPETNREHPGETEIRLLSADYYGNHIRRVEQRAYFTEAEIGDALEMLIYKRSLTMVDGADIITQE